MNMLQRSTLRAAPQWRIRVPAPQAFPLPLPRAEPRVPLPTLLPQPSEHVQRAAHLTLPLLGSAAPSFESGVQLSEDRQIAALLLSPAPPARHMRPPRAMPRVPPAPLLGLRSRASFHMYKARPVQRRRLLLLQRAQLLGLLERMHQQHAHAMHYPLHWPHDWPARQQLLPPVVQHVLPSLLLLTLRRLRCEEQPPA